MAQTDNIYDSIKDPVIKRMLSNFKLSSDAENENRKKGLEALKFRKGGKDQWDDTLYNLRTTTNRPAESYNQIPQFVHQVTNDMRLNMPQTKFVPGTDGSKEVAEAREDLARNIQSSSEGEVAYDNACDSQVTIGWGYWRVITEYKDNKSFDQVIKIRWVPNTFKVYDDPNTMLQDYSDRKYLIEIEDMQKDDFNGQYKGKERYQADGLNERDDYDSFDLDGIGSAQPSWATKDTVRIAEYWEVTNKRSHLYRNKKTGAITSEKPKDMNNYDMREVVTPKVMWYKCTALERLEEREWPGIYIPYIRVSGEMLIIDGTTYFSGLVESMMPAQKQYNYWVNAVTEMVALAPKSPYIAAVGQVKGLEQFWDNANVKNYPYLPYNPIDVNGIQLPPPQRNATGVDISGGSALIQMAQNNFYTTTGLYPASLGQQSNEKSGRAIIARQKEGDVSTFHFSDNLARALRFQGRVFNDLFPKIYDGSRVERVTAEDGSTREVKLNQPFKDEAGQEKTIDMTEGEYDVMVTTGPSYTTKRQEAAESQVQLAQAYPPIMRIAGSNIVRNMDWPGAADIADKLQIVEQAEFPQLKENPDLKDVPPEIQAQMQQAQVVIQQLTAQLQQTQAGLVQAEQELKNKQSEFQLKQADLQLKMQDAQTTAQNDAVKNELDKMKLELEGKKLELEGQRLQLERDKMAIEAAELKLKMLQPNQPPESDAQNL